MLPEFTLFGSRFYTYPLLIGIACALAYVMLERASIFKTKHLRIGFFLGLLISGWLGAKALFLISVDASVAKLASFWIGGGLVFFGGLIGGGLFSIAFLKYFKIELFKLNQLVPILVLCHAIGRIGCFLSGCCYGDVVRGAHFEGIRHPTQIYESLFLFILYGYLKIRQRKNMGLITPYLVGYASFRFGIEFLRGDHLRGFVISGLSTSQLIALIIIITYVLLIKLRKAKSLP